MVSKIQTSNPKQTSSVNQKQGPRTGNTGSPDKRRAFNAAKNNSNSQALADSVIRALELRGNSNKDYLDPGVESLKDSVGPKSNPTASGARLPKGAKAPRRKG